MQRNVLLALFVFMFATFVLIPPQVRAAPNALPAGFTRVEVGDGLTQPTAMAFLGNKIYVTEKTGAIGIIRTNGILRERPFHTLNVSSQSETADSWGLRLTPTMRRMAISISITRPAKAPSAIRARPKIASHG